MTPNLVDTSIISLISSADFVVKLVFFILILASIYSWAIIIDKIFSYGRLQWQMANFQQKFWKIKSLDELEKLSQSESNNPLAEIFTEAIKQSRATNKSQEQKLGSKERVICAMNSLREQNIGVLKKRLDFLATIGSSAVFIGLFGTVWGIMNSFQSIAYMKNTSLAIVAPGIAEALLATAAGLIAAIPANIFYNYFTIRLDAIDSSIHNFCNNLYLIFSRAIDQEEI